MSKIGTHLLADLYGIDLAVLRDERALVGVFRAALDAAGFTVLHHLSHRFADGGQGVTGMFLLSVSHATFHTFPEHGYMAVDIFSCGSADPHAVLGVLTETFKPQTVETQRADRGEKDKPGA
jgi:S-adenosylmethionine decarboxylase